MIVKYTFKVSGNIRLEKAIVCEFKSRKYEFETDEKGILKTISSGVKADVDKYAPQVTTPVSGPEKFQIFIRDEPAALILKEELRNLEGILSLFGMDEIDLAYPEILYIAETEEEKVKIHIQQSKRSLDPDPPLPDPFPPDVLARAILVSFSSFEWQIPFAFYRKAAVDLKNRWYLEACYDFYFLLEYLFSDGKFKKDQVKKAFKDSPELQIAINKFLGDKRKIHLLKTVSKRKFVETLEGKSAKEISDFFVDLRGEIHHQNKKKKNGWHPSNQQEFIFEATLFEKVCTNLMMKTGIELMHGQDIDLKKIRVFQKIASE